MCGNNNFNDKKYKCHVNKDHSVMLLIHKDTSVFFWMESVYKQIPMHTVGEFKRHLRKILRKKSTKDSRKEYTDALELITLWDHS